MAKGSQPAPKADPAIAAAATKQAELGEEWLTFAKDQFAISNDRQVEIDALTKRVADRQLEISEADRARYESVFRPLEDKFVAEAADYASPERQAQAAAEAGAGVQTELAGERGAAARRNAAVGIMPGSGRFEGIDRAVGLGGALATADAENRAREGVRDRGTALTADAINLGKGLPVSSTNAATTALGVTGDANRQYLASTGIVPSGIGGAMQGYGNQANILGAQHGDNLSVWKANQDNAANNAAGFGKFAGTALGLILSSKKAKTDKKPVAEGEALDAVRDMPVEEWAYKDGMGDGGGKRHVGPYAEDFKRETGQGDGETIPVVDAIGITMKAVKDLDTKVSRIAKAVGLGGGEMRRAA
jgi:hypothetical protein